MPLRKTTCPCCSLLKVYRIFLLNSKTSRWWSRSPPSCASSPPLSRTCLAWLAQPFGIQIAGERCWRLGPVYPVDRPLLFGVSRLCFLRLGFPSFSQSSKEARYWTAHASYLQSSQEVSGRVLRLSSEFQGLSRWFCPLSVRCSLPTPPHCLVHCGQAGKLIYPRFL